MKKELPKTAACFLTLLKIGAFTFGGGWSIIAQLQTEFVEKRGWIASEDLADITSIARSLPGIMIINIAVMFGYRVGGVLCGILSAIAIALPSVIVLSIVAIFYNSVRNNVYIARAMVGVRAAVVPIILRAAINLKGGALKERVQYYIAASAFCLCLFTQLNNLLIVVAGAAAGLIYWGGKKDALS